MAEKLDTRQVVTFEELLRAMMFEQEAARRVLVRKGLLTNEEVLEEIKAVRRGRELHIDGALAILMLKFILGSWVDELGNFVSTRVQDL
jgi:hypothetical protein